MLTLTRPHRQVLGTVALLLATVAPTVFVGLTAWRINRPGHVHDVEAELGKRLGMKVTLEAVRYPRPGEAVCTGLVLWQPEPRQKTRLVEVARAEQQVADFHVVALRIQTGPLNRAAHRDKPPSEIGHFLP